MTIRGKYYRELSKGAPIDYARFHHAEIVRIQGIANTAGTTFIETMKVVHALKDVLDSQDTP